MKKKIVVLLSLVLVVCSLFCACGKDTPSVVVTVITNSGEKQEFTSTKEFYNACDSNEAYFEKEYLGAKVTVSAKVESIDNDVRSNPTGEEYRFIANQEVYVINLVDHIQVVVLQEPHSEVINLKGDSEVEITSIIKSTKPFNGSSYRCVLYGITQENDSTLQDSTIITVK